MNAKVTFAPKTQFKMNKTFSILISSLLLAGVLFVSSCSKKDDTKTVTYAIATSEVCEFFSNGVETDESTSEVNLVDIQQAFLASGLVYDVTKVTTAKLTGLSAKVSSGASNFNDVESIEVYLKLATASGKGELIASGSSFSSSASTVNLTVAGKELKGFLGSSCELTTVIRSKSSALNLNICFDLKDGVINAEVIK